MSTAARYAIVRIALVVGAFLLAGDPAVATAQTAEPPPISPADTAWMLMATALVLLMTPALAFFYGGLVRSKNALNTMMMSFVSLGFVGVLWALFGYSLAFGPGGPWLGDTSRFFLRGVGLQAQGTIPHALFMAYQGTFAIITAALISGAIVERMRFSAYVLFISLWALVVYSPIAHWVWGGGWLATLGRARLRRRNGRPRQCRRGGAGGGHRRRASARSIRRRRCCRTTSRSRCSAPGCCGSAGSASMPAARSRPTASRDWRSSRRCSRRPPRSWSGPSSTGSDRASRRPSAPRPRSSSVSSR